MSTLTPHAYMPGGERDLSLVGGMDGAARLSRETAFWSAASQSADVAINRSKEGNDAKAMSLAANDGYIGGAVDVTKDSIVGSQYLLNARPNWRALGADETWAEEFQQVVEGRFQLAAESVENWFDAARKLTFTAKIRLGVGLSVVTGEIVEQVVWRDVVGRPFRTCFQSIDPSRLCNPNDESDTATRRAGVDMDAHGEPQRYWFRQAHRSDGALGDMGAYSWAPVPARLPWGRKQVIHVFDQVLPAQTRGVGAMVGVLKEMRMTQKFRDLQLQNAVVQSIYAAAIESELPPESIYEQLGGSQGTDGVQQYLAAMQGYYGESNGIKLDGVRMPILFPNTKLKFQPAQDMRGLEGYEQSLLRHISARLGLSYEQFSRDYTQTNYSSARASMLETWKYMQGRKKIFADRLSTEMYLLWLEEQINRGEVPMPPGMTWRDFYQGLNREAFGRCTWIGASRGQIDEYKETQAAVLRLTSGLSTLEAESARLGDDFRDIASQRARERALYVDTYGMTYPGDQVLPAKPTAETDIESQSK